MTFNDFMLAIMGKSYKQYFDHYKVKDPKEVMTGIVINLRDLPTSYDDIHIDNCMAATKFLIPVSENLGETMTKLKPTLKKLMSTNVMYSALSVVKIVPYLPEVMGRAMLDEYIKGMDITLSNFSFSSKAWFIGNKKISTIRFFNNIGMQINGGVIASTYNNNLQLSLMAKTNLKMDLKYFLDCLENNLLEEIDKLKENK